MKNRIALLTLLLVPVVLSSCGPKAFTKGSYDDPNKVILLDDKFGENDMQLMSKTLAESLIEYEKIKNASKDPVIMIGAVKNRTSEHIDMQMLTDKIRTALIKTGRFTFSDKGSREELDEEYEYQGGKNVKQSTATKRGNQIGVNYIINGSIGSNVQEVGKDKVVYYKLTLNLIDVSTNLIKWSEEREVRKIYKKRNISN